MVDRVVLPLFDEPLQVLGDSAWGVRDSIPLTPPETIRALDSVQRLFATGRPSAGLADTLARQGISFVVVRNDLDPDNSRSARPLLVHRALEGSRGLTKVAQFGDPVGPGTLDGFVSDSGLRPRYPAVEIYRVTGAATTVPYLADADTMPRIDGGPESLLRLDERRHLMGRNPLGPMVLTQDAQRAGLVFRHHVAGEDVLVELVVGGVRFKRRVELIPLEAAHVLAHEAAQAIVDLPFERDS